VLEADASMTLGRLVERGEWVAVEILHVVDRPVEDPLDAGDGRVAGVGVRVLWVVGGEPLFDVVKLKFA
jgi:hypothetical protein